MNKEKLKTEFRQWWQEMRPRIAKAMIVTGLIFCVVALLSELKSPQICQHQQEAPKNEEK